MATAIPYIDPKVEHVGVSHLRKLNAENLRSNEKTFVIQDNDKPLAVLLSYEQFLCMQNKIQAVLATVEMLADDEERASALRGIEDVTAGRVESLASIRRALKAKHAKKG
jgi:hypothetical protein